MAGYLHPLPARQLGIDLQAELLHLLLEAAQFATQVQAVRLGLILQLVDTFLEFDDGAFEI